MSRLTVKSSAKRTTLVRSIAALFVGGALLAPGVMPEANAQLYWDSNSIAAGAGATPTGTWGASNFWNTDAAGGSGTFTTATVNTDNLFFVAGPGAASGNTAYTVTVSGAQVANGLTFQASGATTLSGGTSITLGDGTPGSGGITMNTNAFGSTAQGAVTINTALSLANSQTWTNNSVNALSFGGGLTLGSTLTFAGSGNFTATAGSFGNAGSGGIVMNGTGVLNVRAAASTNYTGSTTINSGVVLLNAGSKSTGNFNLAGGMVTDYFQQTGAFTSGLGTGANQIQITGNSGFGAGNGTSVWRIGTAGSVLVWGASGEGAATGFFNPTTLKFMTPADNLGPTIFGFVNFDNGINLNGVARTIDVLNASTNPTTSGAQIAGVISNGSLIKTGGGNLTLSNTANTYAGTTTISGGFLTVAATGALGSASNTLEFNGGTLRATGTITSPSTRSVTMTATGIIDNNGQAISIAGNITGAGGLTKNSAGALTLSGTNNYNGITTVNAGTLTITKEAALYNATPASWTAANINLKSGVTLGLNVDSAGTAGFTAANLGTLLGNISVASNATSGLQGSTTLALDTSTATGGTFTPSSAISNSTGAFGGTIALTKLGAGILVVSQVNTYTGATTISAGTLQLNDGGAISSPPLLNNGTFAINQSGTTTQGTNIPALIGGTGSLVNLGAGTLVFNAPNYYTGTTTATAGTITLSHALAIQNSALVTTGAGTVTLSGVTAPILGGLSGATGNLATIITSGYGGVTNLTLNPGTGATNTYAGVIADGATGMNLTKTGAGTQIFTGVNTYTGATFLNAGTLQIGSGASIGKLSGTTGITFNGGTLQFARSTNANIDAINDNALITSNGGTLNLSSGDAGGASANETIGAVDLASGQFNLAWTNAGSSGTTITVGTAGSGLTRSGSTSAVAFSIANTLAKTFIFGQTTTSSNQIIGPWATYGTGTAAQTDYATYNITGGVTNTNGIQGAGIAGTAETAWTTPANVYTNALAAQTLTATRTITALRNTGATATITLASGANLETYGLLNGVATLLTVAPGTGGVLTTPTGGGNLFVNTGSGAITVSAPINDNGSSVTLVKNGSATLSLSSLTSNYSGGTVINAGIVSLTGTVNTDLNGILGGASGGITLNGGRLNVTSANISSAARIVTVEVGGGSLFVNKNNNFTTTGKLAGNGTLNTLDGGGSGTLSTYSFNSTANDFTGRLNGTNTIINVNSFADSANNIALDGATLNYGTGAVAAMTLSSRAIELSGTTGGATITNNNATAANIITINSGLLVTGVGNKTFTLGGTNTGINRFGGNISDAPGSVISLSKDGGGIWALGGTNTYSGNTNLLAVGTTGRLVFQGSQALSPNTKLVFAQNSSAVQSVSFLDDGTGTINFNRPIEFGGNNTSQALNIFVGNNNTANQGSSTGSTTGSTIQAGDIIHTSVATDTGTLSINLTGANSYRLQTGTITLNNLVNRTANNTTTTILNPTSASMTVGAITMATGNTGTANDGIPVLRFDGTSADNRVSGVISNAPDFLTGQALSVQKQSTSTWILEGSNTYSGSTAITGGTLASTNPVQGFGTNLSGISIGGSGILSLRNNSTVSFTNGTSAYNIANSASGATINVDRVSGTGSNTITIGNLPTTAAAATWQLNFTGSNGIGLNAGTVTTPTIAAASHTISNNITGGGTLTLAGVTGGGTGATATLLFNGSANTIVSGAITQAATAQALTKNGTGILTLNGTSSYSGVNTINSGTLEAFTLATGSSSSSIGASGNAAANLVFGAPTATLRYTGSSNITIDRGFTTSTTAGGGATIESSGTGTLSFDNTVPIAYQTAAQTRVLTLGGTNTGANTFGKVITNNTSAATSLVKAGAGSWVLSGTNTYTGTTTVSAGTLVVNGSIATSSNTTLSSTATLGGVGTVGAVTLVSGSTLSPGNSPGTLNTGSMTWTTGANYNWQTTNMTSSTPSGSNFDFLNVAGTLDVQTGFNFNLWSLLSTGPDVNGNATGFGSGTDGYWIVASATTLTNGSNLSTANVFTTANNGTSGFSNSLGGGSFSLVVGASGVGVPGTANDVVLKFTASTGAAPDLAVGAITNPDLFVLRNASLGTATASVALSNGNSNTGSVVTPATYSNPVLTATTGQTISGSGALAPSLVTLTDTTSNLTALNATVTYQTTPTDTATGNNTATVNVRIGNAPLHPTTSSTTFGSALIASTPINVTPYTNLSSNTIGETATGSTVPALGTTATIFNYTNSTGTDTGISMAWRSRTAAEASNIPSLNDNGTLHAGYLISDVVDLTGMQNTVGGFTDTFILQLSYSQALLDGYETDGVTRGKIFVASKVGNAWVNAVNLNSTNAAQYFPNQAYNASARVLGDYGVDPINNVVWAVLNHNSEFAVVPEPSTLVLGGLALLGFAGAGLRKRRLKM